MNSRGKKTTAAAYDDDVEQLLRAAQDDALLKLSINSHIARATSSSAAIDPDLERRLQALKKPPNRSKIDDSTMETKPKKLDTVAKVDGAVVEEKDDDGDDLFARFAALKNTLPCYGKIGNESDGLVDNSIDRDEESEDEVEKVIKWAIDAARLDPSPPTDDDEDDDDDSGDDDEIVDSREKGKRK